MEEFYRISLKIKNKINCCRKYVPMYIIFSDQTYILSVTMCVSFIGSSRNRIIYLPTILYGFCLEKSHAHVIWHHFANFIILIRFSIQWWAVLFWIMHPTSYLGLLSKRETNDASIIFSSIRPYIGGDDVNIAGFYLFLSSSSAPR